MWRRIIFLLFFREWKARETFEVYSPPGCKEMFQSNKQYRYVLVQVLFMDLFYIWTFVFKSVFKL